MNRAFDPYHLWLGIPPEEQPPNHYRLLGLAVRESDEEVIDIAALRLSAHVRTFLKGPHRELAERLLAEIAAADACLLNAATKATYDASLPPSRPSEPPPALWSEAAPTAPVLHPEPPETHIVAATARVSAAPSRQRRENNALQIAKVLAGGIAGLLLGDLMIYLLTGNDLFGVLPSRGNRIEPPAAVVATAKLPTTPPAAATNNAPPAFPTPFESPSPELSAPEPAPAEQEVASLSPRPTVLPASSERPTAPRPQPPPFPTSPPTASELPRDQPDVLSSVPLQWELPSLHSAESAVVAKLARAPDEPLVLTLSCAAARLADGTSLALEPEADGNSWSIHHLADSPLPAKKSSLANIRLSETELRFAWNSLAEEQPRGQVQNCLLHMRHGASAQLIQLRKVHQAGQLVLDMTDDHQIVQLPLSDLPRTEKLRLEIRELVNYPTAAEPSAEASTVLMGKQAIIQSAQLPGAAIRVRFPFTASPANLALRIEPIYRESGRVEFDLSLAWANRFRSSVERELQKDRAALSTLQSSLSKAQNELDRLLSSRPANAAETGSRQRSIANSRSAISSAKNRLGSLREQVTLHEKRLTTLPGIQEFLASVHERAAIRYVIYAESGGQDILLVDGAAPVVSAD
jgi:hypothetical protein